MPQNQPYNRPVIVQQIVKVKKKRSLVRLLSGTIFLLSIFIIIGSVFSVSIWLHTFRVFTQEKVVGELQVSKKIIEDDKPTFTIKYIPADDVSGTLGIFGSDSKSSGEIVTTTLVGDRVFIEGDFISWKDWLTFINFKPVYKISRITSGFQRSDDYKKFNVDAVDLNGGPDQFAAKLQNYPNKYKWFAKSTFLSAAGVNVSVNESRTYEVKVTEDAIVISPKE